MVVGDFERFTVGADVENDALGAFVCVGPENAKEVPLDVFVFASRINTEEDPLAEVVPTWLTDERMELKDERDVPRTHWREKERVPLANMVEFSLLSARALGG